MNNTESFSESTPNGFSKTVTYHGYSIEFIIPKRIHDYILSTSFDLTAYLEDVSAWFDAYLFEVLDWDRDGSPDKEFGKEFQVILYGILDKFVEGTPQGLLVDVNYDPTTRVFGRGRHEKRIQELVKKMRVVDINEMSGRPDFQLIEVTLRKY